MGNCQAAEAATVVLERPGGKVERIYWSVSANEVMKANPGNYVAVIIGSIPSNPQTNAPTIKQLKLLRPEDTLHIGRVYRLVSFEEVLKELAGRKFAQMNNVIPLQKQKQRERRRERTPRETVAHPQRTNHGETPNSAATTESSRVGRRVRRVTPGRPGQWRPALQSIEEGAR